MVDVVHCCFFSFCFRVELMDLNLSLLYDSVAVEEKVGCHPSTWRIGTHLDLGCSVASIWFGYSFQVSSDFDAGFDWKFLELRGKFTWVLLLRMQIDCFHSRLWVGGIIRSRMVFFMVFFKVSTYSRSPNKESIDGLVGTWILLYSSSSERILSISDPVA
jgi:hypothetical protein